MKKRGIARWAALLALPPLLLAGCGGGPAADYGFTYKEVTSDAGVRFVHDKPTFDHKVDNIMPWLASTGAGVAAADYDADGYIDLYFTNTKNNAKNVLYRNNGDGTFTERAVKAGVANANNEGVSEAALWFDYNNSGYPSLFVGAWGKSHLYRNNGDGTFTDVTDAAGVGYKGYVNKAITLDYNRDGLPDLYLGCYFNEKHNFWNLQSTKIMHNDFERARNGGRNVMYRNNGDGTFTDVSAELGVDDTGWTLATGSADLNDDGWPDIYNANDFGSDVLYLNEQGKRFRPVVQRRGIGDDTFKSMNVDFGDVFHDGKFANYVSNISRSEYLLEGNQMWHEDASGKYVDRAVEMGVNLGGWSWGARFFDADNSGNLSLMVTNGFITASKKRDYWFEMGTVATTPGYIVEDTTTWPAFGDKSMSAREEKPLFWNDGKTFKNVSKDVGITFTDDSRGVAAVDLWNRGAQDLVFANQGSPARIYKNELHNGNHWIKLQLVGRAPSTREAIGARVTFEVGGVRTVMERDGGNSHGGQSDPRLHLGLGKHEKVDKLTIRWPSGRVQVLTDVPGDQIFRIEEAER